MIDKMLGEDSRLGLPDLHNTLNDATTVLSALVDFERRDTLAPQRLLGAADRAIAALAQWQSRIARSRDAADCCPALNPQATSAPQ